MPDNDRVLTAVLGIGNLLLGDEGVGVHAVQELMKRSLPEGVAAVDIGTSILEALPWLESAPRIIIIDAMQAGGPAGSVYRIPLLDCETSPSLDSLHGFDLTRALALCGPGASPEIVVIGVEPETITWSLELSAPVAASLPAVLSEVHALLESPYR